MLQLGLAHISPLPSLPPSLCLQLPKEDQLLKQKLRAAARTSFLRKMNSELMTHEELQRLWEVLEELNSPPRAGDELVGGAYGWWVGPTAGRWAYSWWLGLIKGAYDSFPPSISTLSDDSLSRLCDGGESGFREVQVGTIPIMLSCVR